MILDPYTDTSSDKPTTGAREAFGPPKFHQPKEINMQITVTPHKEKIEEIGVQIDTILENMRKLGKLMTGLDQEVEVDPNEQTLELVEDAKNAIAYAMDAHGTLKDTAEEAESSVSNITYELEEVGSQLEKSADALDSIC
jgi:uncharacterized protein Yka (UPF0111/DUF47 family)